MQVVCVLTLHKVWIILALGQIGLGFTLFKLLVLMMQFKGHSLRPESLHLHKVSGESEGPTMQVGGISPNSGQAEMCTPCLGSSGPRPEAGPCSTGYLPLPLLLVSWGTSWTQEAAPKPLRRVWASGVRRLGD